MTIHAGSSELLKFPVISFRKIESPYELNGQKTYCLVADIRKIPEDLSNWRSVNVRDANLNSGVSKQIRQSLIDNPSSFFFKNRGLTIIAQSVRFDNATKLVELELRDKRNNGLLDGGHTFAVIMDYLTGLSEDELADVNAFIRMEVLEGFETHDDVVDIVEARNTSTQVKKQSIEELKGTFSDIERVLKNKPYSERIAYKEFELTDEENRKDIDIKELLSYLVCFDVHAYDDKKHPTIAYTTKSAVLDHFVEAEKKGKLMSQLVPLLPEILELHDTIEVGLPNAYNKSGGKFGKLQGVVDVTNKKMKNTELVFIDKESHYRIPSGFIYPILASFRSLVSCNDGHCSWKTNPIRLFNELKEELANRVCEQAKELRNPNKLGKDIATWRSCYDYVEKEVLKRHL